MELHYIIIAVVIAFILCLQIVSFRSTWKKMGAYRKIFGDAAPYKYALNKNELGKTTGFRVDNVKVRNQYFNRITTTINNYVAGNESIDFQLIKDAVASACDSTEDDIHAQIPIPLYLGLAGTMAGIIVGVGYLWLSGSLDALLAETPGASSTEGIVVLLGGVAIAMICSIVGLSMTTFCTWQFKGCKLRIEQRKGELFAWLQQNLLPEVATDDLQAISKISKSLSAFNATFKRNTADFSTALGAVKTVVSSLGGMAERIEQMAKDAESMADRNALATNRLKRNADILDHFNEYIESITGYVDEVHRFTENFKDETLRLDALEAIRDFFETQRQALEARINEAANAASQMDTMIKTSNRELRQSIENETKELAKVIAGQSKLFTEAIDEQKRIFAEANKEITDGLRDQFSKLPKAVEATNQLPAQMQALLASIEKSNAALVRQVAAAAQRQTSAGPAAAFGEPAAMAGGQTSGSHVSRIAVAAAVLVVVASSVFSGYSVWRMTDALDKQARKPQTETAAPANTATETPADTATTR